MAIEKVPILKLPNLMKGTFIARPNRFIGEMILVD
jgi:DNA-binding sugar fermentation-stimulating protein